MTVFLELPSPRCICTDIMGWGHAGIFLLCGKHRQLLVAIRVAEHDYGVDALAMADRCSLDYGGRV